MTTNFVKKKIQVLQIEISVESDKVLQIEAVIS